MSLIRASGRGDLEEVIRLVEIGANVNEADEVSRKISLFLFDTANPAMN